jgi:hypothetical protein
MLSNPIEMQSWKSLATSYYKLMHRAAWARVEKKFSPVGVKFFNWRESKKKSSARGLS